MAVQAISAREAFKQKCSLTCDEIVQMIDERIASSPGESIYKIDIQSKLPKDSRGCSLICDYLTDHYSSAGWYTEISPTYYEHISSRSTIKHKYILLSLHKIEHEPAPEEAILKFIFGLFLFLCVVGAGALAAVVHAFK